MTRFGTWPNVPTTIVNRAHRWRGFTLVELWVVISILALLVAILIPALRGARKSAKTTVCGTHLHQLGVAIQLYYNENTCYPPHKWKLPDGTNDRWPTAVAEYIRSEEIQICPAVPQWKVGRNNSYGFNYKYLGSLRFNDIGPTPPYERFPVKNVPSPGMTIAYADTDGTGWTKPYDAQGTDVDAWGNHGYTLDPTFIPTYSLETINNEGIQEAYAYLDSRTYISIRHQQDSSNAVWLDGHVSTITPRQVYQDNRHWNGLGREDPQRDAHVAYRVATGVFRYAADIQ